MTKPVRKSTPAQLRAAKTYREKKRASINNHMIAYYERNKQEILRNKKERYQRKKKEMISNRK